jgi:hypothetical protein
MKRSIFLILFIITLSCNNSKEANKPIDENLTIKEITDEVAKELEIIMEFKTNKDAEISFMMDNIQVNEFQTKNIHLIEKVIPTNGTDKIVGKFGTNNISNKMTISLGNKEEKEFEIVSMQFKYGIDIVNITPKDLNNYFGFSKFSVLDTITHKIKTVTVDNAHYPKLYVRKKLWDDLHVKF